MYKQGLCHKIPLDTLVFSLIINPMAWRVLIKSGVSIERLKRPVRRTLNPLVAIYAKRHLDLIVTSTYEGTHSAASLHYCDEAIDIDDPPSEKEEMVEDIKKELGPGFDVILEKDHIHIEYDPK